MRIVSGLLILVVIAIFSLAINSAAPKKDKMPLIWGFTDMIEENQMNEVNYHFNPKQNIWL
ncbi:hypothetical protein KA025_02835 [Candidatus Saccharibacteria bacterium]|nr:hypothetical protein [Candidatus Saccharibacteria bacterium]